MLLDDATSLARAATMPVFIEPCHCCLPCRRLASPSCAASLAARMQLQLHEPPLPPLCEAAEARTDRACDPGLPTPHCPAPPTTPSQTSVAEKKTAVFLVFLLFSFPRALSQTFSLQHLVFFFELLYFGSTLTHANLRELHATSRALREPAPSPPPVTAGNTHRA